MALKVGFIGAGKIAQSLIKGFTNAGLTAPQHIIASASKNDVSDLEVIQKLGCTATTKNTAVVRQSDIAVLAVKPNIVPEVLAEIRDVLEPPKLLVSVAMGITLRKLESSCLENAHVVRVMPNTPCLVATGATAFASGRYASEEDCELTKSLFSSVGTCYQVPESYMDVITAISGSGPAYMFMTLEALSDAGVRHGLPRNLALKLAAQTMLGSAKMVLETGQHPAVMKGEVCSPAGCTIDAMHMLEKEGFRAALMNAVEAAYLRTREAGEE
ncbi:unnamed protein product [Notodromas monacha]|uniref:Pyrroline-5-carboxylate reductase n=1 Tax=Notodromas monacha TaxID=399045 RepID=A0A7R9GAH8_9CRUS|nr:unnamed protein product [Notodromas monacha]CAG0915384.1 unnamed protein product [Notodromas monacha]